MFWMRHHSILFEFYYVPYQKVGTVPTTQGKKISKSPLVVNIHVVSGHFNCTAPSEKCNLQRVRRKGPNVVGRLGQHGLLFRNAHKK